LVGSGRLEKGPAYASSNSPSVQTRVPPAAAGGLETPSPQLSTLDSSSDWPVSEPTASGAGYTHSAVPPRLAPLWQAKLTGKLSQPVVTEGRLFVAEIDSTESPAWTCGRSSALELTGGRARGQPADDSLQRERGVVWLGRRLGLLPCRLRTASWRGGSRSAPRAADSLRWVRSSLSGRHTEPCFSRKPRHVLHPHSLQLFLQQLLYL